MKIFTILLFLGTSLLSGFTCTKHTPGQYIIKTVKSVGVCDKDGHCAVTFSDETFGTVKFPSVGKRFCMEKQGLEWVLAFNQDFCRNR